MPRKPRLESEAGVYHVLNRGNYRANIFAAARTKAAFLSCLAETCLRTGWKVHAWCLMRNHYHLAISTPRANLVEGMQWFQGTFALRFNCFRAEHGHLFQGRYKSLPVDPADGLGSLCHYIHLNPVRAAICSPAVLRRYPWTSLHWLWNESPHPAWYDPQPALTHAGGLASSREDAAHYLRYLTWLAEDEPARKRQRFDEMSTRWCIGSPAFVQTLAEKHRELASRGPGAESDLTRAREIRWLAELNTELARIGRRPEDLLASPQNAPWKLQLAATLKARTTVTNRWLGITLNLGARDEVCRKLGKLSRTTYHRA